MKRTIALIVLALVGWGSWAVAQTSLAPVGASISQLEWLVGSWSTADRSAAGAPTFEERWTPPAGGAMLAVSRTLKGGRMTGFEFLRIVERNGSLVYIAQPGGRPPTEFALTRLAGESATFENPTHDFPKMIRYSRMSDGTLEARVSGGTDASAEVYVFRRQP